MLIINTKITHREAKKKEEEEKEDDKDERERERDKKLSFKWLILAFRRK